MRKIVIEAGHVDLPIDLQVIQEADARWNGQTIELTLNLVLDGQLEMLRAPIALKQAQLLLGRLQTAVAKSN